MTSGADALLPVGATLIDLGADLDVCRLLLGSPPAHVAGFLATSSTTYHGTATYCVQAPPFCGRCISPGGSILDKAANEPPVPDFS